jgi:rubrerythrin
VHPAENRGLRELYVVAGQLRRHWRKLADRLDAAGRPESAELRAGAGAARELLSELTEMTAARGLWGKPAAQGLGARLAGLRNVLMDPALEVNQALRFAVLDAQHVVTLIAYLERLAARRDDEQLRSFLAGWEQRMRDHENAIRELAEALGDDPEDAIMPAAPGIGGRAGHGLANTIGTLGEWFDRRSGR